MSRAQRLTFLGIAVVIAVVAVVLITRGDATTDTASTPTATPTASAAPSQEEASPVQTETPEPTPTPDPVKTLEAGKVTKLKVTQGDTVRFRVASDEAEEIHVHGYDIEDEVQPGKPLSVSFKATITGVFEVEFHGSGEQIGQLSVEPK